MISYWCEVCKAGFNVSMADPSVHILGVVMRCPTSECLGQIKVVPTNSFLPILAQQLFAATRGFGTPPELLLSGEDLCNFLVGRTVVAAELERTSRAHITILKSLDLSGGWRVHCGTSPRGVVIYKITERKNEQGDTSQSGRKPGEDRTQAGPSPEGVIAGQVSSSCEPPLGGPDLSRVHPDSASSAGGSESGS